MTSFQPHHFLKWGSVLGFLSVALGAFAAHALASQLDSQKLEIFKTGVQYQFFHALALLVVGFALSIFSQTDRRRVWLNRSGWAFLLGILFFSGSLYVLAISGVRAWGMVTPVGGIAFLVGWGAFLKGVA